MTALKPGWFRVLTKDYFEAPCDIEIHLADFADLAEAEQCARAHAHDFTKAFVYDEAGTCVFASDSGKP